MNLQELLALSELHSVKVGLSEERLKAQLGNLRNLISFYREYPDLFVDYLASFNEKLGVAPFKFFTYQRVFLRVVMRHRYVYATFPR